MYANTLPGATQDVLAVLGASHIFDNAYLAGGSALALRLGHRISYDFDFFIQKSILAQDVAAQLATIGNFTISLLEPPHTVLGIFNEVKLSLFRYTYPLIGKTDEFKGVHVASVADIAAMKLTAISGRATTRDYVDLYVITRTYPMEQLFTWYDQKFGKLGNNLYVLIRALGFMEDVNVDNMPQMLTPVSWLDVKSFFISESVRLGKKYLEG